MTTLTPVTFSELEGWRDDDVTEAFGAFRRSCAEILAEGHSFRRPLRYGGQRRHWLPACQAVETASDARTFFERHFTPLTVNDQLRPDGLFTGYYEPQVEGRREPSPEFPVPLYRKPDDLVAFAPDQEKAVGLRYGRLVNGAPAPYHTRRDIERGALAGRGLEIVWLKDWADAFFMHIQGSGRVRLPDGTMLRLAYALKSGRPYTAIGGVLVERGAFTRADMSMQSIRAWLAAHPDEARELMWLNESFIFFREVADDDPKLGPPGAQQVPLTPGRSLAVDRDLWAYGMPVWLETTPPAPAGPAPFRRLMIAQDTGSAIIGAARGDVFWGTGPQAAALAGKMKSAGRMTVLLPHDLARALMTAP